MKLENSFFKTLMGSWRGKFLLLAFFSVFSYYSLGYSFRLVGHLHDWRQATLARCIDAALWTFVISRIARGSLSRFKLPKFDMRLLWVGLVMAFFAYPHFRGGHIPNESVWHFLWVFIFSLGIGLDEETFSRGLIFAIFEKKSVWVATAVSAISFGAFHLSNFRGGQELPYTIAQSVNAAAAGVLLAGLMIYSGSIWVPIVMHALWDFPLVTIKGLGQGHVQISWGDVLAQFFENGLMIAVGLLLVWMGVGVNRYR